MTTTYSQTFGDPRTHGAFQDARHGQRPQRVASGGLIGSGHNIVAARHDGHAVGSRAPCPAAAAGPAAAATRGETNHSGARMNGAAGADRDRGGRGADARGGRGADARGGDTWDADSWRARWQQAKSSQSDGEMRACLKEVAQSNYRLMQGPFRDDVSRTELVTQRELRQRMQGHGKDPHVSISTMGTGDALLHYAAALKRSGSVVCALNFANGEHIGGGYLRGARAQEEELCRQFPCLFTSLSRAKEYGQAYPFGPCTYRGGRDAKRYADVLFTPCIVGRRQGQAQGYAIIPDGEVLNNMALVSAAAPDVRSGRETFDPDLVKQAMQSILIAPKLKNPRIDTLILGAWGCGAFGCDPRQVAKLFAEVLKAGLGRLYREIHFAIPDGADRNLQNFQEVLRNEGIPLASL